MVTMTLNPYQGLKLFIPAFDWLSCVTMTLNPYQGLKLGTNHATIRQNRSQ